MINELNDQNNYFMEAYNLANMQTTKSGGVYIPPHRLRAFQENLQKTANESPETTQRFKWELLKKSIVGIINKVNASNIEHIILELFNENILRAKGVLATAIIKAQMASPTYTPIYSALTGVINTKLPEIGSLIIRRVILQFRRSYQRNDRITCFATTKFLAHLINHKILTDFFALQLLVFLLENATADAIELAVSFTIEVGQVLSEVSPAGMNLIFNKFKTILHEGEVERRVQYAIEHLFAVRKNKFESNPGVPKELDLVEEQDQITHVFNLDDDIDGDEALNLFKFDPDYDQNEQDWDEIKQEILGEENIMALKNPQRYMEEEEQPPEEAIHTPLIKDMTQEELVRLRESIYMRIMNSVDFEECAHKLLKMGITESQLPEMCNMVVDCCIEERTYLNYYGLLAERLCKVKEDFMKIFFKIFIERYATIYEYDTNKIRKLAKFFSHLLTTDAIDWHALRCIELTPEATTSSSRIFLKNLFQDLAQNMGITALHDRLTDVDMAENFEGLFPKDNLENTQFAINFFTSIGLKGLTEELREYFFENTQNLQEQEFREEIEPEPEVIFRQEQPKDLKNEREERADRNEKKLKDKRSNLDKKQQDSSTKIQEEQKSSKKLRADFEENRLSPKQKKDNFTVEHTKQIQSKKNERPEIREEKPASSKKQDPKPDKERLKKELSEILKESSSSSDSDSDSSLSESDDHRLKKRKISLKQQPKKSQETKTTYVSKRKRSPSSSSSSESSDSDSRSDSRDRHRSKRKDKKSEKRKDSPKKKSKKRYDSSDSDSESSPSRSRDRKRGQKKHKLR